MLWIIAMMILLWSLWSFIQLLIHLFDGFKSDYKDIKEELLKEHNEPSAYQTISVSIAAFFQTMVHSPRNFFMVLGWMTLGMLLLLLTNGVLELLGSLKDVLDFFLSGGRH